MSYMYLDDVIRVDVDVDVMRILSFALSESCMYVYFIFFQEIYILPWRGWVVHLVDSPHGHLDAVRGVLVRFGILFHSEKSIEIYPRVLLKGVGERLTLQTCLR